MEIEQVNSSLPIDESIPLQNKARLLQQIGIGAIFLFIIVAALGLFGTGVLSDKEISVNGNTLMYEKFGRRSGESKLEFDLAADTVAIIMIPSVYFDHFKIENIVPEPDKNSIAGNQYIYEFNGRDTKRITFYLSPIKTGSMEALIKANETNFNLSHFIYP